MEITEKFSTECVKYQPAKRISGSCNYAGFNSRVSYQARLRFKIILVRYKLRCVCWIRMPQIRLRITTMEYLMSENVYRDQKLFMKFRRFKRWRNICAVTFLPCFNFMLIWLCSNEHLHESGFISKKCRYKLRWWYRIRTKKRGKEEVGIWFPTWLVRFLGKKFSHNEFFRPLIFSLVSITKSKLFGSLSLAQYCWY